MNPKVVKEAKDVLVTLVELLSQGDCLSEVLAEYMPSFGERTNFNGRFVCLVPGSPEDSVHRAALYMQTGEVSWCIQVGDSLHIRSVEYRGYSEGGMLEMKAYPVRELADEQVVEVLALAARKVVDMVVLQPFDDTEAWEAWKEGAREILRRGQGEEEC